MSAPILDRDIIDDLFDHIGAAASRPVFDLLLGESRTLTARIVAAAHDDAGREIMRRAAHSLKSGSGQLGAASLSEAAAAVEHAAGTNAADLADRIATLQQRAAATETALTDFLSQYG